MMMTQGCLVVLKHVLWQWKRQEAQSEDSSHGWLIGKLGGESIPGSFLACGIGQHILCFLSLLLGHSSLPPLSHGSLLEYHFQVPCHKMALVFGIHVYPNLAWPSLNLIIPAMTLFPNKFTFTCAGGNNSHTFSYGIPTTESYLDIEE